MLPGRESPRRLAVFQGNVRVQRPGDDRAHGTARRPSFGRPAGRAAGTVAGSAQLPAAALISHCRRASRRFVRTPRKSGELVRSRRTAWVHRGCCAHNTRSRCNVRLGWRKRSMVRCVGMSASFDGKPLGEAVSGTCELVDPCDIAQTLQGSPDRLAPHPCPAGQFKESALERISSPCIGIFRTPRGG